MNALFIIPEQLITEQAIQALAWSLIHFLWQGLAIATFVVLLLKLARSARPTTRYLVCLWGLLAMLACPIVTLTCFDPVPVAWQATNDTHQTTSPVIESGSSDWPTEVTTETDQKIFGDTKSPVDLPPELDSRQQENLVGNDQFAEDFGEPEIVSQLDNTEEDSALSFSAAALFSKDAPRWIVGVWLVGTALFSLRLLLSWIGIWRLRKQVAPVPNWVATKTEQLAKAIVVAKPLIKTSQLVTEAIAVGFFKPMILLPASWLTELPPDMLETIIVHELAHIRRGDLWVNLMQRVVEALLFYHPAVWWLSDRTRIERELCCDAIVVDITENPLRYAETLERVGRLSFAQVTPTSNLKSLNVSSVGSRKVLLGRIQSVLGAPHRERSSPTWAVVTVALVIGCLITVSTLQSVPPTLTESDDEGEVMNNEDDFNEFASELPPAEPLDQNDSQRNQTPIGELEISIEPEKLKQAKQKLDELDKGNASTQVPANQKPDDPIPAIGRANSCLLYTSDAADE